HLKWYHLDGSHPPWTMDEYGLYDKTGTSSLEQTSGCFNILYEFFNQMKELGIYKDATIIITGDHPSHDMLAVPERPMLTGLFVKPAGEEGSALRYSNAPVSIGNLRATCVQAVGGDSLPWGKTYFEVDETDQISRHYYHRFSTNGNREHYIADYRITGDARDWSNWVLVGLTPIDSKNWWG
ncbi:MAG: hypothetical protein FWH42_06150, partial [Dehalococcoidia bacterium]|nr:hypothetical protein [Dehalococcoidia bacterium]